MKLDKKLCKVGLISLALISLMTRNNAEAGTVKLMNTAQSATEINVISILNEKPYCRKCLESPLQMCGRETATIMVPPEAFQGGNYFTILHISSGLSGGKCKIMKFHFLKQL
jgi:hypothetical protein